MRSISLLGWILVVQSLESEIVITLSTGSVGILKFALLGSLLPSPSHIASVANVANIGNVGNKGIKGKQTNDTCWRYVVLYTLTLDSYTYLKREIPEERHACMKLNANGARNSRLSPGLRKRKGDCSIK